MAMVNRTWVRNGSVWAVNVSFILNSKIVDIAVDPDI